MIDAVQTGPLGVNTYIVSTAARDAFVVDPACCAFCGDDRAFLRRLEIAHLAVRAIFLTHGHFDHIAGLGVLKRAYPGAKIVIHKDDAAAIGANGATLQRRTLEDMGFSAFMGALADLPGADCEVAGGETLGGAATCPALDGWRIIHTPGHTPGSCCLYNEKDGALISGDTVFYRSWGRTDLPGGDERAMMKSLRMIYSTIPKDTKVYPGHDAYGFRLGDNLN